MSDTRFKKVTKEEAEYDIALALLPFLLENGTPVYIRRDGWLSYKLSSGLRDGKHDGQHI